MHTYYHFYVYDCNYIKRKNVKTIEIINVIKSNIRHLRATPSDTLVPVPEKIR